MDKCQHDINRPKSSVILSKRMCLTYPCHREGVCKHCFASLLYIKNQDGLYVLKEVNGEDSRSDTESIK